MYSTGKICGGSFTHVLKFGSHFYPWGKDIYLAVDKIRDF